MRVPTSTGAKFTHRESEKKVAMLEAIARAGMPKTLRSKAVRTEKE